MYEFIITHSRTPRSGKWGEVITHKRASELWRTRKQFPVKYRHVHMGDYYVTVSIPNKGV